MWHVRRRASALAALLVAASHLSEASQEWKKAFGGQKYDVIVLGTGMKECVLSGLLSKAGRRVLHLDRNAYYGGSSACCDLAKLFEAYGGTAPEPSVAGGLGNPQSYYVDSAPKFMLIKGKLATILMDTGAHRHMQFRRVDDSLVMRNGELHHLPTTGKEVTTSPLVSIQVRPQGGAEGARTERRRGARSGAEGRAQGGAQGARTKRGGARDGSGAERAAVGLGRERRGVRWRRGGTTAARAEGSAGARAMRHPSCERTLRVAPVPSRGTSARSLIAAAAPMRRRPPPPAPPAPRRPPRAARAAPPAPRGLCRAGEDPGLALLQLGEPL